MAGVEDIVKEHYVPMSDNTPTQMSTWFYAEATAIQWTEALGALSTNPLHKQF